MLSQPQLSTSGAESANAHREALFKVLSLLRAARSELHCRYRRFTAIPSSKVFRCTLFSTTAVTSVSLFVAFADAVNSSAKPSWRSRVRAGRLGVWSDCPTSHLDSNLRVVSQARRTVQRAFLLDVAIRQCSVHVSPATPLRMFPSWISVRLGMSTCERLETVVSRQTAEFIERPVCQHRGARLHPSFIHSACCSAKVRRCWSGGVRSLPWVLLHSTA